MYLPQKQIKGSSYSSNLHIEYSIKIQRSVGLFSDLEYYNWLKHECNPKVIDFCEQPLVIEGYYQGKKVRSIFDMWVLFSDTTERFEEVKPSSKLLTSSSSYEKVKKQLTVQKEWCDAHSKKYCIRTEKEIFNNLVLLNNLRKLYGFVRGMQYVNPEELEKVLLYVTSGKKKLLEVISHLNKPSSEVFSLVFTLVYIGKCTMDIYTRPIDFNTEVELGCLEIV